MATTFRSWPEYKSVEAFVQPGSAWIPRVGPGGA